MKLTKSDCEDIEMLINISFSLFNSINKLCQLEIDGDKDSEEFKDILHGAKGELALEEDIFDRIVIDPNKCVDIINLLKSNSKFKNSICTSETLGFICNTTNIPNSDLILQHLLNKLILKALENNTLNIEVMPKESEFLEKLFQYNQYLKSALAVDISSLFLTLIENTKLIAIGNEKDKLIKSEYHNAFVTCKLLENFLESNCKVSQKPILIHHNAIIFYPFSDEVETKLKKQILFNTLDAFFASFTAFLKLDTLNENSIHTIYLIQMLIRSTMILIEDEETRQIATEKIKEFAKKLENNLDNEKYLFIYNILNEILNSMETDRSIPQYVSFGRM